MANLQPLLEISLGNVRLSEREDFVIGMPVTSEVHVPLVEPISCLAVGVGVAGNNVLEALVSNEPVPALSVLARNATFRASRIANKLLVGGAMLKGGGSQGDRELAISAVSADLQQIKTTIAGNELVFVVAGMARGTGGGNAPTVARMVNEQGGLPIGIAIMPFAHTGITMSLRANDALRLLQLECPAIVRFNNEAICVRHPRAMSKEMMDKANAAIAAMIATIKEAAGSFSADGSSFADFKQHFLRGTSLLVASCMVEADLSAKEQISAVLANSLTGSDITGASSSILVLTSKKGVQFNHLDRLKVQMGAASNNIHHACSISERYDPGMPANTIRLSIVCSIKGAVRQNFADASTSFVQPRTALADYKVRDTTISLTDKIKERMSAANLVADPAEPFAGATSPKHSVPPKRTDEPVSDTGLKNSHQTTNHASSATHRSFNG